MIGAMVVPNELKAWAKLRRLDALLRSEHGDVRVGRHLQYGDARCDHKQGQQEEGEKTGRGPG